MSLRDKPKVAHRLLIKSGSGKALRCYGEGGIRTLDTLLRYNALAKRITEPTIGSIASTPHATLRLGQNLEAESELLRHVFG